MLRRRAAQKFKNPALLDISLKSFRYWGGSMLAFVTNVNVPEIARVLGIEAEKALSDACTVSRRLETRTSKLPARPR
jgi:hypothetical protein